MVLMCFINVKMLQYPGIYYISIGKHTVVVS
jgi:hypothetical protein